LAFEGKYDEKNKTYLPDSYAIYQKFRQNDNISHFICRLAYCRNEDLRKWFLTQESRLFQIRLQAVSASEVLLMLNKHLGIAYEALKPDDPEWTNADMRDCICFKVDAL
jgi:DNA primase large subunit